MSDQLLLEFVKHVLLEDSYFQRKYGSKLAAFQQSAVADFSDALDSPLSPTPAADKSIPRMPESAPAIVYDSPLSPPLADKGILGTPPSLAATPISPIVSQTMDRPAPASTSEKMDTTEPVSDPEFSETSSTSSSEDDYQVVGKGKRKKGKNSQASSAKKPVSNIAVLSPASSRPSSPKLAAAAQTSRPASPRANPPASTKKPRPPPPLFIQDKSKWTGVSKMCMDRNIQYTSARSTQQGIKVIVPTTSDYRELSRQLRGRNIAFHTYSLPEETPTRVVIRRLPKEISTEDILSDLQRQEIPATAVHRLHKARGGEQYDMVLVVCDPVDGHHPIFKIKSVCSLTGISIEKPYRSNIVGQCHRCQLYGHSQKNCFAPHRCVKCLGDHSTADCPRPKDRTQCTEPPSCVLCGQSGHPANYRGCPKAPKASSAKLAKRASARQQRESPSVRLPSNQLPERLGPQRPSPWNALNHQKAFPALAKVDATPIPGLLDAPNPPPAPRVAAPALSSRAAPVASPALPRPAPPGPEVSEESSFGTIARFAVFVTPEADRMAAELRQTKDILVIQRIFAAYPRIEAALRALNN